MSDAPAHPLAGAAPAGDLGAPGAAPAGRLVPLAAWHAPLYCHAPGDEPFDPSVLGEAGDHLDRWSLPGEPTAYLAADPAVALAELARHHRPGGGRSERRVVRLDPAGSGVDGLVDLRDPAIRHAVGGPASLGSFLDRDAARATAARVRADERHRGLIVPSMAFLDDPARCTIVLFADRLGDLAAHLRPGADVARLVIDRA